MTESWIFIRALEKPAEERVAFLDEQCVGDPALRERLEVLLHAHENPASFLQIPAENLGATVEPMGEATGAVHDGGRRADEVGSGTRIGPYKLLEAIGEGGMGTVYMAEQAAPVRRTVALKVVKPGMDSRQVLARFAAERQALALMDHPNIAKVLDAGATDQSRPYFVMELVKGVPITQFCDERRLTPRERLELFIPVCRAVQHAHQKGVIHRDLKPSNVLVALYDGKPMPKVIDFGVAKAMSEKLTEATLYTGFGMVVGTPEYMSPEQAELNQLDVDTRSDIYGLGVLLYELLTGSTPLQHERIKKAAVLEVLRLIREEEPSPPSLRLGTTEELPAIAASRSIEPRRLQRMVRGELDWIVMKCLEKDRGRRYESANGLARDLERHLDDEPVAAGPPSAAYRIRKFTRRNRAALLVAGLLLSVSVVLGTMAGWVARDRAARRAAVEREAGLALRDAERLQGDEKWPEALEAVRRAEGILAGTGGRVVRERARRLRADLEMVQRLDQIHLIASRYEVDRFDYERADREYASAFVDRGIDVAGLPTDEAAAQIRGLPEIAVALVSALDDWALLRWERDDQAGARSLLRLAQASDSDPWRRAAREALEADGGKLAALTESPTSLQQPPANLHMVAKFLGLKGQGRSQVELLRRAQQQYPADFWINYTLGGALIRQRPARPNEAISYFRAALAVRPRSNAVWHDLGSVLFSKDDLKGAEFYYRKAIEIAPSQRNALGNLALCLRRQRRYDEAIPWLRKVMEIDPNDAWPHNTLGLIQYEKKEVAAAMASYLKALELDPKFALAHSNLGIVFRDQGDRDAASASFRKALELNPKCSDAHMGLGRIHLDGGRHDEAVTHLRKAVELEPKFAAWHCYLGHALRAQGRPDAALACFRKAVELGPEFAHRHGEVGSLLLALSKPVEAAASYAKAIELEPKQASLHNGLGLARRGEGRPEEALACFRKALALDPKSANAYHNIGLIYLDKDKFDDSVSYHQKAIELNPSNASAYRNIGLARGAQGRPEEALAAFRKAFELDPKHAIARQELVDALMTRAAGLAQRGRRDEAVVDYREVLRLRPNHAETHLRLGRIFQREGATGEAIGIYEDALKFAGEAAAQDPRSLAGIQRELHALLDAAGREQDAGRLFDQSRTTWEKQAETGQIHPRWELAWLLVSWPDLERHDARRALDLAERLVADAPSQQHFWRVLGAAHLRARDWPAAIAALEKADGRSNGTSAWDGFFLAMAHWENGSKDEARRWYDRATENLEQCRGHGDIGEILQFQAEARAVMGLECAKSEAAPPPLD